MPAPRWLARFNLHVTNRILGPLALYVPGMGVIVHVGRKTQRVHRTPVLIFRQGDRLVVALTYGRESEWVRNVIARNGCVLETQGKSVQLTSPYLYRDDKRRAVPGFVRIMLGLMNVSDFLELTEAGSTQVEHGQEPKHFNQSRPEVLKGWKEIAGFLGEPVSVAQRWESEGMPVTREGRSVTSTPERLNDWLARVSKKPVHIVTPESNLTAELKRGLAFAKKR